jgi:4'-phosphopantetheinyl transferase
MSFETGLAHVWVLELSTLNEVDVARFDRVLSLTERDRMRRFHFVQDRDAYRAAHGLARISLSSCEPGVPPQAWAFEENSRGRPEISPEGGLPRLRFNISHTRLAVACIVTRDLDCGVDVEQTHRCTDLDSLIHAVLAPSEAATVAAAPDSERPMLFCRYWTLKEAYAKALGLGMTLAFDGIAFDLFNGSARLQPYSDEWHFEQWSTPAHTLAAAVRVRGPFRLIRHCGLPHNVLAEIHL